MLDTLDTISALDLTLQGSIGSFRIGEPSSERKSHEVVYLQTHIGINFRSASNEEKLLSKISPFREIFDYGQLEFDEIMQRDIDDARVSSELIPYILDNNFQNTVKFFPPIVIMILPIKDGENTPAKKYPKVVRNIIQEESSNKGYGLKEIRSGEPEKEIFQFIYPFKADKEIYHDLVKLKLNTTKTRLIIVDGQHRAMALLALYRNQMTNEWMHPKREPFKEYYEEWTQERIKKFNLEHIHLPAILCTVPSIDENYTGEFDLTKASRSIFLTLNKTARRVSKTRNILLDDKDIISFFMRSTLSRIKNKNLESSGAFRIWNVELDQILDNTVLKSRVAITGVRHIYDMIEYLMLDDENVNGVKPRTSRVKKRTQLSCCLHRLDGENILGTQIASTIKKDLFSIEAAQKLDAVFSEIYGINIINIFDKFSPYFYHNWAVSLLEDELKNHANRRIRPILFDGQGIYRVFQDHRDHLQEKINDGFFAEDAPAVKALKIRIDKTANEIENTLSKLEKTRTFLYLDEIKEKNQLKNEDGEFHEKFTQLFNQMYNQIYSSVAFQIAIACTFFGEIEKIEKPLISNEEFCLEKYFKEYIDQLNDFFAPNTISKLKKLINVFFGELPENLNSDWKIIPSNKTFREVVFNLEMQPTQWPKYRYLFLELWTPSDDRLKKIINEEKSICRDQVMNNVFDNNKDEYIRENSKPENELDKDDYEQIFEKAYNAYSTLIKNLTNKKLDQKEMWQYILSTNKEIASNNEDFVDE